MTHTEIIEPKKITVEFKVQIMSNGELQFVKISQEGGGEILLTKEQANSLVSELIKRQ